MGDLADTDKVNVKSVAVIASQNSKGRFLPSFIAIERIEVDDLTKSFDDGGYSIDYRDNMIGSLRLVDIATNYITNQLLYAKLNGLRTLVMMMGQNALCHNWARESRFMRMHTVMHGRLEFAVCTPATELKNNNRGELTSVMYPSTLGRYAVGYYDSTEVVDHNSGKRPNGRIEELARRLEVTEESLEDMTRARRSTGWSRGGMRD